MKQLSRAIFLLCTAGAAGVAGAQDAALRPDLATLPGVPQQVLPAAAVARAVAAAPRRARPFDFAAGIDQTLGVTAGRWEAAAGAHTWRVRLLSPGARSLSVHLGTLPPDMRLWAYDAGGRVVHGPYDAADAAGSGLWTPIVEGDELVLELRAAAPRPFDLGPVRIYHGYRTWKAEEVPAKAGACNVDVACPQGSNWANEARSVARVEFGSGLRFLCTGQLLNNVRQDKKAFFLTANHCGIGDDEPADSTVFYFNYQAASCGGGASLGDADTAHGATFLADDVQSDFTLLRIADALPGNVYFSGWNATGQGSGSGAAIHHPGGDEKKISLYTSPVTQTSANIGAACAVDSWQVKWSEGTTEQGSSGGGLWSSSRQLIGVLSGGTASCSNSGGLDYFGRIDRAWTANPGREGQLKAHLDPGNTCIASVPGLDASASAAPLTTGPRRCSGDASSCGPFRGGGGGMPGPVLLVLAAALLARRRGVAGRGAPVSRDIC